MRKALAQLYFLASLAAAQNAAPTGPFTLPALPYAPQALAPAIDSLTMVIHHDKHHAAYVQNLNNQAAQNPKLAQLSPEALQGQISQFNTAVRNNGGGHFNHAFFWETMAAVGQGGQASAKLLEQIKKDFGGMEQLKKAFADAGLTRFGSGWAWISWQPQTQKLIVTSTPNQDNPLMDVIPQSEQGIPLLALDVWEHAYYLRYQNRRADYAAAWWNLIDWNRVNARFDRAIASKP